MRIAMFAGTRPEILKIAPVVLACRRAGHVVTIVATGQQNDPAMIDAAYVSVGLRPDVTITLPDGPGRSGALLTEITATLTKFRPELALAVGDTTTVAHTALAARTAGIPFGHLEAGLRSFNERSQEEINRKVAAACGTLHFAPTAVARRMLLTEGVTDERIFVVGNPIIDALATSGQTRVPLAARDGILVTAHRATNVDDPDRLTRLVRLVRALADQAGPVTFPLHPRTAARLDENNLTAHLKHPRIRLTAPLPWEDLLNVLAGSKAVVTDSGGLQEEASYFGIPAVVLRKSTPRWEGVENGSSSLHGIDDETSISHALASALAFITPEQQTRVNALACPYGDGTTGPQVADLLHQPHVQALLTLREPDYTGGQLPW
jgi:UDP-N-acetylglucosamine 2-epimerase (non-hydrolysing)